MQNSDFWTRRVNLYRSQISRVVLCLQSSVISPRTTCLYGSQPFSVVFACKTASFGPVYESLWVPDLTCRFVHAKQRILVQNFSLYGSHPWSAVSACQTASFGPELQVSMCPRPYLSFCACKIAWFAPEYQVYMGSSTHLWLWAHITAYLTQE